jgi:hypothetical protein
MLSSTVWPDDPVTGKVCIPDKEDRIPTFWEPIRRKSLTWCCDRQPARQRAGRRTVATLPASTATTAAVTTI